jgi:hypothetical protein
MPLDSVGLSDVILDKMPLRKVYLLVQFDLRKLQVETKSEALIALQVGNWLLPNCNRGFAPT